MRLLVILVMLALSSCCTRDYRLVDVNTLKFKAGDGVLMSGFYSNCFGTVMKHALYKYTDEENYYYVKVFCGAGANEDYVTIEESSLKKRISNE